MKDHKDIRQANEQYHEWIAADYETAHPACFDRGSVVRQRLESIIAEMARDSGGGTLIEFGCGTGSLLSFAKQHFDNVIGVDISPAMLQQADARGLDVLKGDIVKLPFEDNSFDAAICISVLHHLHSPEQVLREMVRVLKPGKPLWTDHDPNKQFILKWPSVNRVFRRFFRHEEHVTENVGKKHDVGAEKWLEVERDAEYLAGPGMDAERLFQELKTMGCQEPCVEYHAYGDLPGPALKLMNILKWEYWPKYIGPYFRLRAKSPI